MTEPRDGSGDGAHDSAPSPADPLSSPARTVAVTRAQVDAARILAAHFEATGQPVPDAVAKIAAAKKKEAAG